jgi:hypothetical protein
VCKDDFGGRGRRECLSIASGGCSSNAWYTERTGSGLPLIQRCCFRLASHGAPVQGFGLLVLALGVVERRQVIEAARRVGMQWAQLLSLIVTGVREENGRFLPVI